MDAILKFYNVIWNTGQLPADWKHSVITPALKSNKNASDPYSYRPTALTSVLYKVMEEGFPLVYDGGWKIWDNLTSFSSDSGSNEAAKITSSVHQTT